MKRITIFRNLVFVLVFMSAVTLWAETKVLERSTKKTPEWVSSGVAEGFLVINVQAPTLGAAQDAALQKITESIVKAVASNVSVSQSNVMSEIIRNGKVDSNDSFSKSTSIQGARLPFLNDITLAKANETYWERKMDKKTKKEFYDYAVKYPFPPSERRRLIREFEEYDAAREAELTELEEGLRTTVSVDGINQAIGSLDALEQYFVDNVRAARVKALRTQYKDLIKQVSVYGQFVEPGVLVCGLQLNGYRFAVSTIDKVTSNCARIVSTTQNENQFTIKFDSSDCLHEEENTITVAFRVGDRRIEHMFDMYEILGGYKSDTQQQFAVVPEGKIYLNAASSSASNRTVSNISLRMTLNNKGGYEFGVKSIELKVPELASELVLDNINLVYSTPGLVQVNVVAEGTFRIAQRRSSTTSFATGYVTVVNPQNGAVERLRVTLPYATNWNK